jgi:uncharacterized protein (TIGR02677 family)
MTDVTGRLRVFAYVNADKAPLYRAIMRAFVEAKARFMLHLRPQEVTDTLASASLQEPTDPAAVEAALAQLREWGNLEAHPDTADVATVEEFYRPRYLFQLTREGEAAERALTVYEETLRQRGELQSAALSDIRVFMGELAQLAEAPEPDEGKAHRVLRTLRDRFEELTSRAQAFMSSLQRITKLPIRMPRLGTSPTRSRSAMVASPGGTSPEAVYRRRRMETRTSRSSSASATPGSWK